jgi:hypothetical protein
LPSGEGADVHGVTCSGGCNNLAACQEGCSANLLAGGSCRAFAYPAGGTTCWFKDGTHNMVGYDNNCASDCNCAGYGFDFRPDDCKPPAAPPIPPVAPPPLPPPSPPDNYLAFPPGPPSTGGCYPSSEGTAVSDMQGNANGPTLDDCKVSCDAVAECRAFALVNGNTCYFKQGDFCNTCADYVCTVPSDCACDKPVGSGFYYQRPFSPPSSPPSLPPPPSSPAPPSLPPLPPLTPTCSDWATFATGCLPSSEGTDVMASTSGDAESCKAACAAGLAAGGGCRAFALVATTCYFKDGTHGTDLTCHYDDRSFHYRPDYCPPPAPPASPPAPPSSPSPPSLPPSPPSLPPSPPALPQPTAAPSVAPSAAPSAMPSTDICGAGGVPSGLRGSLLTGVARDLNLHRRGLAMRACSLRVACAHAPIVPARRRPSDGRLLCLLGRGRPELPC